MILNRIQALLELSWSRVFSTIFVVYLLSVGRSIAIDFRLKSASGNGTDHGTRAFDQRRRFSQPRQRIPIRARIDFAGLIPLVLSRRFTFFLL
jgi:hypothetical protein